MPKGPPFEMKADMPIAKRLAVARAELAGRLAALHGGDDWNTRDRHGPSIQWLGGEIWELEQKLKATED